uniref:Uncharacterized protein AlNc14C144G7341 n=1 Tax=Albugo laibachii Nc14 TaxID=890382 RepID=F0WLF3_9STRA|nr:conserved hypothetical protein [Albugo laibachii Nc14]CCA23392.1 conserved hypothetical protein [Albugo laibachii Nc14]|eukprot:CCA23392.1 conserved hypothetical protein [Albugo laibachii Nc14]
MEFESKSLLWQVSRSNDQVIGTRIYNTKNNEKCILISSKNEIVELSLPEKKQLNHWVLRPAKQIKLGAIKNTNSKTYFAPIQLGEKPAITSWKETDTDASTWSTVEMESFTGVFDIFVHSILQEGCIAVMEDGSVHFVPQSPLQTTELYRNKGECSKSTTSWAGVADTHQKSGSGLSTFLFVLTINSDTLMYEMIVFLLSVPSKGAQKRPRISFLAKQKLHRKETGSNASEITVSSCAFHDEMITHSIVWSNGEWDLLQWHYDSLNMKLRNAGRRVMPHLAREGIKSVLGSSKKRKHEPDSASYQFVASSTGLGGYLLLANTSPLTTITSWNVRFGAKVACISADWSDTIAQNCNRKLGKLHRLLSPSIGELVIAEFDSGVGMLTIRTTQPTLASVLGSGAPKERNGQHSQHETNVSNIDRPSKLQTADLFAKDWKQCPYELLLKTGETCLKQPNQNTWCILQKIIESNRLTSGTMPSLMTTLMQKQQFCLLDEAIKNLVDINEICLVRLLQYFLKNRGNATLQAYILTQYRKLNSGTPSQHEISSLEKSDMLSEYFIANVMKRPVNDVFLHAAIQLLQVDEALALLAFCQRFLLLITSHSAVDGSNDAYVQCFMPFCPPSTVVLHWIGVLLDTHYTAVVLLGGQNVTKIEQDFKTLAKIVEIQANRIQEEERLKVILESVVAPGRNKCSTTRAIADYSIEQLDF